MNLRLTPNGVSQWWNSCLAFIQPCVWSTAHTKINISRIYLYTYSPIICVASLFLYSLLPNRKLNYTEVEMCIIFLHRKTVFPPYNKEKLRIYNWRDSYHTYFMFKFYIWKKSSVDALCIFCHATISSELKYSLWEEGGKLIKPGKKANLRRQGEQKFGRFTNLLKVTRRANT